MTAQILPVFVAQGHKYSPGQCQSMILSPSRSREDTPFQKATQGSYKNLGQKSNF